MVCRVFFLYFPFLRVFMFLLFLVCPFIFFISHLFFLIYLVVFSSILFFSVSSFSFVCCRMFSFRLISFILFPFVLLCSSSGLFFYFLFLRVVFFCRVYYNLFLSLSVLSCFDFFFAISSLGFLVCSLSASCILHLMLS